VTAPGGSEADRAARERLAREARVTATTLLDWVGSRVEGAAATGTARPGSTAARPPQSPGPCGWCPVCALVAAVRGEQPELTAHLAEQASALLVVLRLLIQSHAHDHPAHEHERPVPEDPAAGTAAAPTSPRRTASPTSTGPDLPADLLANPDVPWDAPHAVFDPDPAPTPPPPDGSSRPAPDRPTGKRGPRPSPRPRPADVSTTPAAPPVPSAPAAPAPVEPRTPAPAPAPAPAERVPTGTRAPAAPTRGVQRIPVRRRPRPC
jgi:hypothetical protein